MLCCISGCHNRTIRAAYKMCSLHWAIYIKDIPKEQREPWVIFLMQAADREHKRSIRDAIRETSLDFMLDNGQIGHEEMTIYAGPERRSTQRRRTSGNTERPKSNIPELDLATR